MKISKLFQQYGWLIFGALIVIGFGLHLRLYPLTHLVNTEYEHRATLLVVNQMQQDIAKKIQIAHPTLSAEEKNNLTQQQLSDAMRSDKRTMWKSIEATTQELAKQSDLNVHPYLLASDSYYFLWLTKNVLENGDISTQINNGKFFGDKMLAPVGQWEPFTAHPYIGAWVYHTISLIKPNIELMTALGFTPLLIFTFIIVLFFIFSRAINVSIINTIISASFFSCVHIFLKRSTYGWYDSDPYNVLFPLIIFLCFYLTNTSHRSKLYSILGGLSIALYSLFWQGWLFVFPIILLTIGFYFLFLWVTRKKIPLTLLTNNALLIISCIIFLFLFYGANYFYFYIHHLIDGITRLTSSNTASLWPDLFLGVGELKRLSMLELIHICGGTIVFLLALTGLIKLIITSIQSTKNQQALFLSIMLGVWFIATTLLSIKAQRFGLLMLPPLMLFMGLGINLITDQIKRILPRPTHFIAIILPLLIIIIPLLNGYASIRDLLNPIFNSTWDRALTYIRNNTPSNSIVTSWWTPGHFIKAIANRAVTFDGASIKSPQGYWVSKILLSNNEEHALGMLRMLNGSSNESVDYLMQTHKWPLPKAINFINHLTSLTPNKALQLTSTLFTSLEATKIISLTHHSPVPSQLLIYHEMIDDPVLLSIFDTWDFNQAAESIKHDDSLAINDNKTMNYNLDIVGNGYRYSDIKPIINENNTLLIFNDNIVINKESKSTLINSKTYGKGIPKSIVYLENGHVVEKKLNNATLSYSIVLSQNRHGKWQVNLMDSPLANSLLVKLYYFDAAGLNYFSLLNNEHDYTDQTRIKTFDVNWKKFTDWEAHHADEQE